MRLFIPVVLIAMSVPVAAGAQTQSVIMRKPIKDATFGGPGGYSPPSGGPSSPSTDPSEDAGSSGTEQGSWTMSPPVLVAPACSEQAPATREIWCEGAGEARLPDSACASSPKPSSMTSVPDYSGCGYAWQITSRSAWSSQCSTAATRTVVSECQRQDGLVVADSLCGGSSRPAATEEAEVLSNCTYTPTYSSTWSACESGVNLQRAPIISCTRSDGVVVANSKCGSNAQESVRACLYAACGDLIQSRYSSTYGTYNIETVAGVNTPEDAKRLCQNTSPPSGYQTVRCSWRSVERQAKIITVKKGTNSGSNETTGYSEPGIPASAFWTAACVPQ